MYLKELSIVQFRNILSADIQLDSGVNCFYAPNAQGKTNLLDAIYYLGYGKSYFNALDSHCVTHEKDFFLLQSKCENQSAYDLHISYKKGKKKIIKKNGKEYPRIADHIGFLPVVMISPYDADLINGFSDARRKFLDAVISVYSRSYLENLIKYQNVVKSRNKLLKDMWKSRRFDNNMLDAWDVQLMQYGNRIDADRENFIKEFIPLFNAYYQKISGGNEVASLELKKSQNEELSFEENLIRAREKDRVLQHTTVGPHRDDLDFTIEGMSVKRFGSQGQQKSFLTALKLGKFFMVKQKTSKTPILLLDDIFDKLDHSRVENLMQTISETEFGQIFITHTEENDLKKVFKGQKVSFFHVENGNIVSS